MTNIIKSISCIFVVGIALSACQADDPVSSQTEIAVKTPELIEAPMSTTREEIMLAAAEGASFSIIMDRCPEDDEGYIPGEPDFLGTVKCGERYSGSYNLTTGQYTVSGLNEGTSAEYSATFEGPDPRQNVISIWGGIYAIDEDLSAKGNVEGEFVTVGTFELSK